MVKVSIVVPVYNVSGFLDECLKSVIKQSLKDIEIICIDDGSTDDSLDIIKKYAKTDKRIKYATKPNSGYGNSMNLGFSMATGEYIGIVESDDYVDRRMFKTLYGVAKKGNYEVVKSDFKEFSTVQGKKNHKYVSTAPHKSYYNRNINHTETQEIFHFAMNTWTGIYLRSFIEKNSIKHNETPGAAYQDNGFWFQTLALAERICFVNKAFYHYRQDNPNSSINSKSKVFCMCEEYSYIDDFLKSNPDLDKKLRVIFLKKKYYNYIYTYNRIATEYKIDFLLRFGEEFETPIQDGILTEKNTDPRILSVMKRVVENPERFFIEDSVWTLQHETERIMKSQRKPTPKEIIGDIYGKIIKKYREYTG